MESTGASSSDTTPPARYILKNLPPSLTEEKCKDLLSETPYSHLRFLPGSPPSARNPMLPWMPSAVILTFENSTSMSQKVDRFIEKWNGRDCREGNRTFQAVVDIFPLQHVPEQLAPRSYESSALYKEFLEELEKCSGRKQNLSGDDLSSMLMKAERKLKPWLDDPAWAKKTPLLEHLAAIKKPSKARHVDSTEKKKKKKKKNRSAPTEAMQEVPSDDNLPSGFFFDHSGSQQSSKKPENCDRPVKTFKTSSLKSNHDSAKDRSVKDVDKKMAALNVARSSEAEQRKVTILSRPVQPESEPQGPHLVRTQPLPKRSTIPSAFKHTRASGSSFTETEISTGEFILVSSTEEKSGKPPSSPSRYFVQGPKAPRDDHKASKAGREESRERSKELKTHPRPARRLSKDQGHEIVRLNSDKGDEDAVNRTSLTPAVDSQSGITTGCEKPKKVFSVKALKQKSTQSP